MINLNPPPIKVKLIKSELNVFFQYLNKSVTDAFTGIHHYHHQKEREFFLKWHLKELIGRVFEKVLSVFHYPDHKNISLSITQAEQQMLSQIFQRVDCCPYMLQMQPRFINQLTRLS